MQDARYVHEKKHAVVPEITNLELLLETQIIIMRHKEFFNLYPANVEYRVSS